ncbi:MAG: redoxin domain-containing protein [Pirellulaceae bacterium]|nr:redoxin domain-containing protein [Pirellulaceae bacterium]
MIRSLQIISLCIISLCIVSLGTSATALAEAPVAAIGKVKTFSLPGIDGTTVTLSTHIDVQYHVLCFLGTECPLARVYGPRLQRMSQSYADKGVRFVGINSNVQDSMAELQQYAREHSLTFPMAKDFDRSVAMNVGATRTPEVIVVDRGGRIRYRGRIDDQYQVGVARSEASVHDLRAALDQLIAGEAVSIPVTTAVGCLISLPRMVPQSDSEVDYCNQISRVLQRHCIECHRIDEIGPFSLEDYSEVVGWGEMMIEVIDDHRMPPWHASPEHGSFANERHMSDQDKQLIRDWVDAGMPYGDPDQLPMPVERLSGWRLPRQPDAVFAMHKEPFAVPADGTVEYQYFVIDPKFTEDKWVTAAEIIPGDRSVVHHCIAFIRPPDGSDFRSFGMLAGYVPGQFVSPLPAGYARRIPAGSRIVMQMHYTPNGKPTLDQTRVGLLFADQATITHEVYAIGGIEQEFEIPPHEADHQIASTVERYPRDGELLSIMPHMHLRGKSFELNVESDSGTQTVLKVPHYDFNWQHNYELSDPIPLRSVRRIGFQATFDNSADNPFNPDPNEYVSWGDQTWQEMAVVFVAVAKPRDPATIGLASPGDDTPTATESTERAEMLKQREERAAKRADAYTNEYMARLDRNSDGYLSQHELPHSVRLFHFWSLESDSDGVISRAEVRENAYWRFLNE